MNLDVFAATIQRDRQAARDAVESEGKHRGSAATNRQTTPPPAPTRWDCASKPAAQDAGGV